MIKTREEYINACDFIDSDMELYDFQISEKMNSYEYNLYLQDTEYFLNFLYEKTRTLEELCDYLDNYAETKIRKTRKDIEKSLDVLEQTMDIYNSDKTISVTPIWNDTISDIVFDRNGEAISAANVDEDHVEAAYNLYNKVSPVLFTETEQKSIYNKIEDFDLGNYMVSIQTSSNLTVQDTSEIDVQVIIPETVTWNSISADPVNCTLSFTKNREGVLIKIASNGYDKELRSFSYDPYMGSSLNNIIDEDTVPIPFDTFIHGRRVLYDARADRQNRDYIQEVIHAQQTEEKNQNKSDKIWYTK